MHGLLQQAITLDHQLLGTPHASPAAKKSAAAKLAAEQTGHRQSGSSRGSHGKVANSKQAQQLAAEIADATENAQAKFEHDMALSLQLTKAVAEEAAKLHHVKIVRAESSQAEEAAAGAGPSEAKGSGHPRLTPTDPIPAAQLEASPGRLTQSKQAQATPPGPTSDPVGRESASAPLPQSAPQQGSSAATTLSRECDRQINAGTGPQLGLGQGSPSEAPGPALSQAALGDAISPRRSSRQRAGEMGQTAEAAAAEVEFSAQRMTRSMQASVSSRTDDVTPAASRQAGVHPTSLSHMHRQTRSTQAQSKSLDSNKSHGEEEEQAGQAYLAAPLEVELHSSQLPSSSSCERRGRSAQLRSSTQHTVTTASPQTETASGDEHQDTLQTSPRQTRSLRVQPPLVSSRQGGELLPSSIRAAVLLEYTDVELLSSSSRTALLLECTMWYCQQCKQCCCAVCWCSFKQLPTPGISAVSMQCSAWCSD